MNPYEVERLAAERQADYRRETDTIAEHGAHAGRVGVAVAGALRGVADWLGTTHFAPRGRINAIDRPVLRKRGLSTILGPLQQEDTRPAPKA